MSVMPPGTPLAHTRTRTAAHTRTRTHLARVQLDDAEQQLPAESQRERRLRRACAGARRLPRHVHDRVHAARNAGVEDLLALEIAVHVRGHPDDLRGEGGGTEGCALCH
jgi:hypothetical protein